MRMRQGLLKLKVVRAKGVLTFVRAILALASSVIVGVMVFGLLGSFLFRKGIMSDAALFVFPWYGLIPGFIAGAIWYIKIMVGK
jgi:hypothetical protein